MPLENLTPNAESANVVGKYRLLRRIATGGMAEVFLATDDGKALWAVKLILSHLADQPEFLGLFLDEARLASVIKHPNVAQVRDMGMENGRLFLAMEYVRGQPLSALISRLNEKQLGLSPAQAAGILAQAAAGLNAAHEAKARDGSPMELVHRDVSPQNLLLTEDGVVKVVDFGIAKARNKLVVTQVNTTRGKPWYMSPEQMRGEKLDRRADIFSLGAVLFELLLGSRLFEGDVDQVMYKALNEPLPNILAQKPDVPPELAEMVGKACAKNPDDRFETAWEMEQELLAFAKGQGGAGDLGKLVTDHFPRMPASVEEVLGQSQSREPAARPSTRSVAVHRVVARPPTGQRAAAAVPPVGEISRPVKIRRPGTVAGSTTDEVQLDAGSSGGDAPEPDIEPPPEPKPPEPKTPEPSPPAPPEGSGTLLVRKAAPPEAPGKSKQLLIGGAVVGVFLALGAGGAWYLAQREKPLPKPAPAPTPLLIPKAAVKPPARKNPFAALDHLSEQPPAAASSGGPAPNSEVIHAQLGHVRISCSELCTLYLDGQPWASGGPGNPLAADVKPGRHRLAALLGQDSKPGREHRFRVHADETYVTHFGRTDGRFLTATGVYSYAGEALQDERHGEWSRAAKNLRMALSLSPGIAVLHRDLGRVLVHTGDASAARFQLESYLYMAPKARDADDVRAEISKIAP